MSVIAEDLRRQITRKVVLEFLAARQALRFEAQTILQRLKDIPGKVDFTLDADDVGAAIAFLRGKAWVEVFPNKFGSGLFVQATSEGVLQSERGEME